MIAKDPVVQLYGDNRVYFLRNEKDRCDLYAEIHTTLHGDGLPQLSEEQQQSATSRVIMILLSYIADASRPEGIDVYTIYSAEDNLWISCKLRIIHDNIVILKIYYENR